MGTEQSNRVLAAIGAVSAILAAGGSSVFASQIKAQKSNAASGYTRHTHVSLQSIETLNKVQDGADRQTSVIYTGHNGALDNVKVQTMQPVLRTVNVQMSPQHTYAVKTGDSLWSIAAAEDTTVDELMANNQLTSSIIHVGQKLSLEEPPTPSSEASATTASAAPIEAEEALKTVNLVSTFDTKVDQTKDDTVVQSDFKSTSTDKIANASADSLSSTVVTSAATSTTAVSAVSASKSKATTSIAPTSQQTKAVTTNNVISTLAADKTGTSHVSSTATSTQTATLSSSKVTTSSAATSVSSSTTQLKSQSNSDVSNVVTSNATIKHADSVSSQAVPAPSVSDQASTFTQTNESTQSITSQAATTAVSAAPTPSQPNYTADQSTRTKVVQTAVDYQNQQVPYVWGGASTQGADCSGLVQQAYAAAGVSLPHNTVAQEAYFNAQPVNAAQPGDVLFWGPQGATYHNAIAIGDSQYIAAPEPGKNVQTYTMDGQNFMPSFSGSLRQ
ncbi:MAG: NlpC/P60 family protein [Furfurilactobacillus sp.]|jgi:cell wall-associated NlpC family hydrolase|uniref:NlpC/P60 family protein n=1 Tax=Furfurilactobacillus milii TaxID=2888272 RepID=A0ABT6D6M4_9LACO|nr:MULTISPECIES: C40 family peptidase [Furfurilactobacillus]QLE66380.1 extracellular protein gamma-D-glutamate-meso-diaminopimelate muropeptidase [Furfurilactobacillus rossiae]MCF6159836.1 NlpC/P60 family protein [Furfurilactobacillus milii]MCF6162615.1 NlpC/P60 family protein [Furfurilactobacillus milii]MCF6419214.1 NlpC/P60 family protein [Furfurilactobacillus milii]MCH4010910.1 NlpC/P60 family protein [Furfurilactobacillus sp.]